MSNSITFSICIPVYNAEKYLDDCIHSVLNQSYENFEIILVDDGSKDGSGDICDLYSKSYPTIKTIHKDNAGQISARVTAVENAVGKYIVFLDSDDTLEPHALATIHSAFNKYDVDFVMYDFQRVTNGVITHPNEARKDEILLVSKADIYKFILKSQNNNSLCMKCFKKDIFLSIDYTDYFHLRHGEDLLQVMDLIRHCERAVVIPDILYNYTYNPTSVSNAPASIKSIVDSRLVVREFVLHRLIEEQIFTEEDMLEYQEYCCNLILNQLSLIAHAKATLKEKIDTLKHLRESNYYNTFLFNVKFDIRKLGQKRLMYSLFNARMYRTLIFLLQARTFIRNMFKRK